MPKEIIQVRTKLVEKDGNKYPVFVMNLKGKAVTLKLRQNGFNVRDIPLGYCKLEVENLGEESGAFYKTYWADPIRVVEK